MLHSKLLSPSQRLNACLTQDSAHVKPGDRGDFVKLIQVALLRIDNSVIPPAETDAGLYGTGTASAVLSYKTARKIINTAYQTQPDNIVGKMTIKSLDDEMVKIEAAPPGDLFAAALRPVFGRLV